MGGAECRLQLAQEPDAVPRARRLVAEALAGSDVPGDLAPDGELVVTELVTNALLHVGPPVEVRVSTRGRRLRVEVADGSRLPPLQHHPAVEGMTGRGLGLVAALSDRWGVDREPAGKVVWAELVAGTAGTDGTVGTAGTDGTVSTVVPGDGRGAADGDGAADRQGAADGQGAAGLEATWPDLPVVGDERITVVLGDVPTELLVAAKTHVDNLVREFALAARGARSGRTQAVPADLAQLIEVVTSRFAEARLAIKRQALAAVRAGEARTRLELTLPTSAADAGEDYLRALESADAYARNAQLLTLETPPTHWAFRRWYVTAVIEQLRRAARGDPPAPLRSFEQQLLDELAMLAGTRRAADRAASLQAVTAALAAATSPEEVAGIVVSQGAAALAATGGSVLAPGREDVLEVAGAVGYPPAVVERLRAERRDADLPAAEALRRGQPVWLESRRSCAAQFPDLAALEPDTQALCAVPLRVANELVGALRFSFERPRRFDEAERRFVLALADQTAQALERARLFAAERAARARVTFLADATELLTSSLEPQETVDHLTALLVPAFADWAVVYLLDGSGRPWAAKVAHRDPKVGRLIDQRIRRRAVDLSAEGGVGEALRTGQSRYYAKVPEELRRRAVERIDPDRAADLAPDSGMVVPLTGRGRVVGAVALARTSGPEYSADDLRLVEDVASRAAVALQNAQAYDREREAALTLQRSLLPQRLPKVPGVAFAWRYHPAGSSAQVGGDWYDVIPMGRDRVAVVIGDVMGRGLQAAGIMGQLRATARAAVEAVGAGQLQPAAVLSQLDRAVGRLEQGQITTAVFAVLAPASRILTVTSAGHLPPLLVTPGAGADLLAVEPGPPLGAGGGRYEELTVRLAPGALLLLYTDGLVEDRERPVDEGLAILCRAAAEVSQPEQLCDAALGALGRTGDHDDDVALLAVGLAAS